LERVCRAYSRPDVAYRLLQLQLRRAGNQTRALQSSQGRRPRSPSFSRRTTPLPCGSGGTRRAALRPPVSAPVLVPLGCPSLPNRDAASNAPPPKLAPRSIVGINVHGSKDRVKDASPCACNDVSCLRRVHTHRSRMLTAFPSSASFGHPLSSARQLPREDTRERRRTDLGPRSDDAPRRAPPSSRPGCL
jgi:hypothetical protein